MRILKYILLILFIIFLFINADDIGKKGLQLKNKKGNEGYRWAICVGINDYWDNKITDLEKARNDALLLGEVLSNNGQFNKVFIMSDDLNPKEDKYPTKFNIEEKIQYIADMANPNDLVVFHFSGHGISDDNGDSYLITADTRIDNPYSTSVKLNNIVNKLNKSGIKKVLYMIDACREEVSKTKSLSERGFNSKIYEESEVAATFYATKQGWFSYEDPASNNGIFTRFVVDGLNGKADMNNDTVVSFSELDQYVTDAIYNYAVSIDLKQRPYTKIYGEKYGDLLLSITSVKTDKESKTKSEEKTKEINTYTTNTISINENNHFLSSKDVNNYEILKEKNITNCYGGLYIKDNLLFTGIENGVAVLDITDPLNPVKISTINLTKSILGEKISQVFANYFYIKDNFLIILVSDSNLNISTKLAKSEIRVYDIENISKSYIISTLQLSKNIIGDGWYSIISNGWFVYDNEIYLSSSNNTIIIDISDPENLFVKDILNYKGNVESSGSVKNLCYYKKNDTILIIYDSIFSYNLKNREEINKINIDWKLRDGSTGRRNIAINNNNLFYSTNGYIISFDISDLTKPMILGNITNNNNRHLKLNKDFLFVSNYIYQNGKGYDVVNIYNIKNPSNIGIMKSIEISDPFDKNLWIQSIEIKDKYTYILTGFFDNSRYRKENDKGLLILGPKYE